MNSTSNNLELLKRVAESSNPEQYKCYRKLRWLRRKSKKGKKSKNC